MKEFPQSPAPEGARGSLLIESVSKRRGNVKVLEDVSLDIRPGEFVALLGPSGCGKTTLLRLIGGLDSVDRGRIVISGRDMASLEAHERPVHTVFQSYALFPHLTVFENVAFGLRVRRRPDDEVRTRVARALEAVRLSGLESRQISEISGGQSQRVALARALILDPDILLLDEPLAALDAQLRATMRAELVELQRSVRATFILVTHDLEEAIECSSRIAVMREGHIAQFAEPRTIFERPANAYVAKLVGMENLIDAHVVSADDRVIRLDVGFREIAVDAALVPKDLSKIGVHAEHVELKAPGTGAGLEGTLDDVRYLGETTRCLVRVRDRLLTASVPPTSPFKQGDRVSVRIPEDAFVPLGP